VAFSALEGVSRSFCFLAGFACGGVDDEGRGVTDFFDPARLVFARSEVPEPRVLGAGLVLVSIPDVDGTDEAGSVLEVALETRGRDEIFAAAVPTAGFVAEIVCATFSGPGGLTVGEGEAALSCTLDHCVSVDMHMFTKRLTCFPRDELWPRSHRFGSSKRFTSSTRLSW